MNRKADNERKRVNQTLSRFLGRPIDIATSTEDDETMAANPTRVLGPYYAKNRDLWRLVVFEGERRKSVSASSEEEAILLKAQIERALTDLCTLTVGQALDQFIAAKRQEGLQARSLVTLDYKLRYFLPLEDSLSSITAARAQAIYTAETERLSRYGRPVTAQTHHSVLRLSKLMFRWLVQAGHLRANPFEKVKPVGKANAGKAQLRIDEARRLVSVGAEAGSRGEEGPTAVLTQLLLGLRSGEVLQRQVRDLDDAARILWIPKGKTKNARRRLEVPELLRPFLLRLIEGKRPECLIFGAGRTEPHPHIWLWRHLRKLCRAAGLPRVCPHSLRGLHSSLAIAAGSTPGVVASALGHGSFAVTAKHYVDPDTLKNSAVSKVAGALTAPACDPLERLRTLPPEKLSALLAMLDGAKV